MKSQMSTYKEVKQICRCGDSKAYAIIRMLNGELEQKGYLVLSGKVPTKYLLERIYGVEEES